jgi:transcriptional regulator with XRE-family HTH domain
MRKPQNIKPESAEGIAMMDVGSILREQRRNRNETLQVVATRAHTDAGNLSRIERNKQQLTVVQLVRLCDALGLPLEEFARRLDAVRIKPRRIRDPGGGTFDAARRRLALGLPVLTGGRRQA